MADVARENALVAEVSRLRSEVRALREMIPVAAIQGATSLCWTESHRWELGDPRTASHWEHVAVVLNGFLLALKLTPPRRRHAARGGTT